MKFIIPQNYNFKNKIFGIIDYSTSPHNQNHHSISGKKTDLGNTCKNQRMPRFQILKYTLLIWYFHEVCSQIPPCAHRETGQTLSSLLPYSHLCPWTKSTDDRNQSVWPVPAIFRLLLPLSDSVGNKYGYRPAMPPDNRIHPAQWTPIQTPCNVLRICTFSHNHAVWSTDLQTDC